MYVDYRGLNKIIKKNWRPLFFIRETLDRLQEIIVFTKLDIRDIYYRIRIRKKDKWKIVFRIYYKYFKYTVMLFDLINTPTIF